MNKQNSCLKWQICAPPQMIRETPYEIILVKIYDLLLIARPKFWDLFYVYKNPTKCKLGLYKWAIKCSNLKDFYL